MEKYNVDLMNEINVAAYFLAKENHPYDRLCWMLAERRLIYRNKRDDIPGDLIKADAAANFFSSCEYDVMCWLIAELDILMKYDIYDKKI